MGGACRREVRCAHCGLCRPHRARGLCQPCYRDAGVRAAHDPARNESWTGQEVRLLRRMARDGERLADIAEEVGRSRRSVGHKLRALGLGRSAGATGRRPDPFARARVMAALGEGCGTRELARRLGLRSPGVTPTLRRLVRDGLVVVEWCGGRPVYRPSPSWRDGRDAMHDDAA